MMLIFLYIHGILNTKKNLIKYLNQSYQNTINKLTSYQIFQNDYMKMHQEQMHIIVDGMVLIKLWV